jgi:hypothetical protein
MLEDDTQRGPGIIEAAGRGETITFPSAAGTGGAAVELLFEVTPGGAPPAAHVDPL